MEDATARRAVCLLSGGLDSTTCLAIALAGGYECYCLSFNYGQRHKLELQAATAVARSLQAKAHQIVNIDLRAFGTSSLTSDMEVPKDRSDQDRADAGIPSTYVPARNTIFLSFALAYAEVTGSSDIFIGVNAIDYSGYPDCRPEYISVFEHLANLATKTGVEGTTRLTIQAPLQLLTKADIVRKAVELNVDLSLTLSCYDPDANGKPCQHCDSCILRAKGFLEAGVRDPLVSGTA